MLEAGIIFKYNTESKSDETKNPECFPAVSSEAHPYAYACFEVSLLLWYSYCPVYISIVDGSSIFIEIE